MSIEGAEQLVKIELARAEIEIEHPGWESMVRHSAFMRWLYGQPESVRALARSMKAAHAITLLDMYKRRI